MDARVYLLTPARYGGGIRVLTVILGPILGFRGLEDGEWRTCALVVAERNVAPPELTWFVDNEGRRNEVESASERTHLKSFKGFDVWRFDWSVEQSDGEQSIVYSLGDGTEYRFSVPATDQPLRVAYGSCAGFSSLGEMKKVGNKNAMWDVLGEQNREEPYHLMLLGGDQVYADLVWDTVAPLRNRLAGLGGARDWYHAEFTDDIKTAVEEFYFDLYLQRWAQIEPSGLLAQIPSLMMWDDHDVFDGWGSYPQEQQDSPVFRGIWEQAREHFRLFQLQAADDLALPPGMLCKPDEHNEQPNFTYAYRIGDLALAVLDMRSERTQKRVMSLKTWNALQEWMDKELEGCRHLFVVSSIPVVYVNSNLVEAAFGFLPGQQDLEDDFKDQWLSRTHKEERLRLIHRLLKFSQKSGCRATIVSGDVHVAALGYVQSARDGSANEKPNVINQLISSAIVHPPPPGLIVYAMEKVMADNVEEVDRGITARMMKFPFSAQHFIAKRNWLSLELDEESRVWAKWYVEGEKEPYTKVVHPIGER
jgi:hypothetical protein